MTENDAAPASASTENIVEFPEAKRGKASTTIYRATKRRQFTIIATETLTDKALSVEARGMLAYLLTRPDDWTICLKQIAAELRIGRDKTQKIMRELQTAGYAQHRGERNPASGRFDVKRWVIFELANGTSKETRNPVDDLFRKSAKAPHPENPSTDNPSTDNPQPGNQAPIPITEKQPNNDFNLTPKPHAQAPTWVEFCSKWPWGSTDSPEAAQRVWKRLSGEDQALALRSIPIFIGKVDEQGNKRPHAKAYLRDRRWVVAQESAEAPAIAKHSRDAPQSVTPMVVAREARSVPLGDGRFSIFEGSAQAAAWTDHLAATGRKQLKFIERHRGPGFCVLPSEWPPSSTGARADDQDRRRWPKRSAG